MVVIEIPKEKTVEENVFLQDKPVKVIIFMKEEDKPVNQTIISKNIDSTYSHTLKILNRLKEIKLVQFEETGRLKMVKLTEMGRAAADSLAEFTRIVALAELDGKIDRIYEKEVKGKLRPERDKESIKKQYGTIKENLKVYFEGYPQNISILARKMSTRVDNILAEVMGLPPEAYMSFQEGQS